MDKGKGLNLNKRKLLWIAALLAAFIVLCGMPYVSYGAAGDGSISVTMRDSESGKAISGGKMSLYLVGQKSGDGYVLTGNFKQSGFSLINISSANLAADLAGYADEEKLQEQNQTVDGAGKAVFSGLSDGLYLIVQSEACDGYYAINPFLVTVRYGQAVDATPKMEPAESKPDEPDNPLIPITGDDARLALYALILLAAVCLFTGFFIVKRKKEKQ